MRSFAASSCISIVEPQRGVPMMNTGASISMPRVSALSRLRLSSFINRALGGSPAGTAC